MMTLEEIDALSKETIHNLSMGRSSGEAYLIVCQMKLLVESLIMWTAGKEAWEAMEMEKMKSDGNVEAKNE